MTMGRSSTLVLAVVGWLVACGSVSHVERIELVNETGYPANVDVRGSEGGWLNLATVSAESSKEIEQVIDQGATWTFRFSYGGHDPLEIEITRADLVAAGWRVEVPSELEDVLRAEDVPPPP